MYATAFLQKKNVRHSLSIEKKMDNFTWKKLSTIFIFKVHIVNKLSSLELMQNCVFQISTVSASVSFSADPSHTVPRNILHNQKLEAQERGSASSTPQYQLYDRRNNPSLPSLPAHSISSGHSYEEVDPIYETAFPRAPPNTASKTATIGRRPSFTQYRRHWSDDSDISTQQTGASYLARSSTFKYQQIFYHYIINQIVYKIFNKKKY